MWRRDENVIKIKLLRLVLSLALARHSSFCIKIFPKHTHLTINFILHFTQQDSEFFKGKDCPLKWFEERNEW